MEIGSARSKHQQRILDEASEWFVDFREGDIDATVRQAFNTWLRTSPEHIEAYLEVAAFWADVPLAVPKDGVDVDALIASTRAESNVVPLEVSRAFEEAARTDVSIPVPDHGRRRHWRPALLVASVVGMLVAGGVFAYLRVWAGTYTTGIGEQRSIALADGSRVDLNARSRIRVHFLENERDVDLIEGQALFRVAKDKARPFIVTSDGTEVRAVGTEFDVYRRATGTTVTVLEGRVSVVADAAKAIDRLPPASLRMSPLSGISAPPTNDASRRESGAAIFVSAGEQVTVTAAEVKAPQRADMVAVTAWTQRQLIFQGAPLADVVEEFNRYNVKPLVIRDTELNAKRVSGVFSSTDPEPLLQFLRDVPTIRVHETERAIEISRQ